MRKKAWWKSRTLWTNGIALIASIVAVTTGQEVPGETIVGIMGFLNILLRLDTTEPIV